DPVKTTLPIACFGAGFRRCPPDTLAKLSQAWPTTVEWRCLVASWYSMIWARRGRLAHQCSQIFGNHFRHVAHQVLKLRYVLTEEMDTPAGVGVRVETFRVEDAVVFHIVTVDVVWLDDKALAREFCGVLLDVLQLSQGVVCLDERRHGQL